MENEYIAVLDNIGKSFPGVRALDKVSLKLRKGSVHGIVGENGAGKSTLIKILSGTYSNYEGVITVKGEEVHFRSEKDAFEKGISVVTQELNPIDELTVEENIYLGREPSKGIFINKNKRREDTIACLNSLGVDFDPTDKMSELSIARKQLVEITKAISRNAQLIIMDEPTSALTEVETKQLFEQIKKLKSEGISIVYISHKLDEVFELCDTITVIRDGKHIATVASSDVTQDEVVSMMVGREIDNIYPQIGDSVSSKEALRVEGLCCEGVRNVNFTVKAGEILGFAGMMGAGRSETIRAVFGLDERSGGDIYISGRKVKIRKPLDAIKLGMGMVTEDRAAYGFIGMRPIDDNTILASADVFAPRLFLKKKLISEKVNKISKALRVKAPNVKTLLSTLSGGNQQKVVLAKWLVREHLSVLFLDEPTRGIDVGAKQEIYQLIKELAEQGLAIVLISSELPEVIALSHRVMVIAEGMIVGELKRGEATQEAIMTAIVKGKKAQ